MSDFDPGAVIDGRYRVLSRVGAGGMADVYLAEDAQLEREVALKLLHRRFAADPGFVERFRREAQAAASLQHPNVVSVFDRGSFDDTYYIAMEYLDGRSLKQVIREEAPLEPARAIDLTVQILKATRFAHRRGVIHRDLKPHNVIVDSGDHAKVTDFGIARAGASDMTETGSIMGTAQYLSPEQAQGQAVSAPSDLYSVGVILYELLTGQVPFDGESPVAIALKHVAEAPIPPSQLNPAVSPALEQVVLWALNKSPDDRPADADQLIEALEQARGSVTGEATASMPVLGAAGLLGADPAGPATALIPPGGAVASYGTAQGLLNGERFDRYDDDHGGRSGGGRLWPWIVVLLVLLAIAGGVLAFLLTRPTKVSVPDVTGLSLTAARARLDTAGLIPDVITIPGKARAQTVTAQSPKPFARADKGSLVQLTVSAGPQSVSIPSVVGDTPKQARSALKRQGLKVAAKVLRAPSATVPSGEVTGTSPPSGTSVPAGSNVTLYVSAGGPRTHVPDVVGYTLSAAEQQLAASFLVPRVRHQTTTALSPNTVISQTPAPRTALKRGSTVTLTVARAPDKVPPVVGDSAAAASSTLSSAGYRVARSYQAVTAASQNGLVIRQSPKGNATAAKGTVVTIVIGRYNGTGTTGTSTSPGSPSSP